MQNDVYTKIRRRDERWNRRQCRGYIDGLNNNAPEQIGALFAPDGFFSDGAGRQIGAPDRIGTGPDEVAEIFKGIMSQYKMGAKVLSMNDRFMEYDVYLGEEMTLPCVGLMSVNEKGQISEYLIRPR